MLQHRRVQRRFTTVAVALVAAVVVSVVGCRSDAPRDRVVGITTTTLEAAGDRHCSWPDRRVQLAQLLMVGFDGPTPAPEGQRLLGEGIGAVVLYKNRGNIESAVQVRALVAALQEQSAIPLQVAVDEEGGRVSRFRGMITPVPAAQSVGQRPPHAIRAIGAQMGEELRGLGVTTALAPVLDLSSGGRVLGDRSYGSDPAAVGDAGSAFAQGLHDAGIVAVGKHFPGLGAAVGDPHDGTSRIDRTEAELRLRELVPFQTAIRGGMNAVMVAHVTLPKIDPELPASLSPRLFQLLRAVGFAGVAMVDGLEMAAVQQRWAMETAAEMALSAGADQLLLNTSPDRVRAVLDHLQAAMESGRLPARRIQEAFVRVERLKGLTTWDRCAA